MPNIDEIRELLSGNEPNVIRRPNWKVSTRVGEITNFNGSQIINFEIVGMGAFPDQILIATEDSRNGATSLSRWITVPYEIAAGLLEGLLQAEAGIADLEATDKASWPGLPLLVIEVEAQGQTVKVQTCIYKDYLEVHLSKPKAAGNGQWQKFRKQDVRSAARLILQAYDAIVAAMDAGAAGQGPYGDGIPF